MKTQTAVRARGIATTATRYALVLLTAVTLNFLLPRFMPGDPMQTILGDAYLNLGSEEAARARAEAGLDDPLLLQYLNYWVNIFHGQLGESLGSGTPVAQLIQQRLPWTLFVSVSSVAIASLIGLALGTVSAWLRGTRRDGAILSTMVALDATPTFWLGMMFIGVFSITLGWLPSYGAVSPATEFTGAGWLHDVARHAALPVLTLVLLSIPSVYFTARYAAVGVREQDFVRTAQAKGISKARVLTHHVARNAAIPVMSIVLLRLGYAFGGAVVVETVFSYPGVGRLMYEAVAARDFPVLQGCFLVFTCAVLTAGLIGKLVSPVIDPRMRQR